MHLGVLPLLLLSNPYQALIDRHAPIKAVVDDGLLRRRVSLDIRGRPPSIAEQTNGDERPIERWLASDEAARHWGALWTDVLVQTQMGGKANRRLFASWLADEWKKDTPWSEIVEQMLTASGDRMTVGPVSFLMSFGSFEESAGGTARLLLGSSIQCAQCHDHPDQPYTVRDFYGLMAFFVRTRSGAGNLVDIERGHARLPSGDVVYPRFLGAPSSDHPNGHDRRIELARQTLAHRDFSRAIVNRVWAMYLGRGLIENVDDLADVQAEDEPRKKLLDALADRLVQDGFRLRPLVIGILSSRAYRAKSTESPFAFQPRALNPEQLVSSLLAVTGLADGVAPERLDQRMQVVLQFLHAAGDEPSVPRALMLMNGRALQLGFRTREGTALRAILDATSDDDARIERMFLTALSRRPSVEEQRAFRARLGSVAANEKDRVWEDGYWALVNSAEFSSHF